jgi:hypothetical protein
MKALVVALFFCVSLASSAIRQADFQKNTVVAEKTLGSNAKAVIAVDTDDVVQEIIVDPESKKGEVTVQADLGVRVLNSGNLSLATVIPKGEVATLARRVSLGSGTTVHAIIAWGYSKYPKILTARCHLYVFTEQRGEVKLVVEEELGSELEQFVVTDMNQDQKPVLLVSTSENEEASMDIWQIQNDGEVKKIQRISGYRVYTLADRFLDKGQGIIVEEKLDAGVAGGTCVQTTEYSWSPKQRKFVKHI